MPVTKIQKDEILLKCWEIFNREGYNHTSLQMLAEATGLGKSGVLHHFGSKEGIMQAVLQYSLTAFKDYVLAPINENLPADQQLEKLLRRQNRLAKLDRRGCFYANIGLETGRDGVFNQVIQEAFQAWLNAVSSIYEKVYSPEEAKVKAYRTLLEYEGSVLFYKLSGEESHLEQFVKRAVDPFRADLITHQKHHQIS